MIHASEDLAKLGAHLKQTLDQFEKDRQLLEVQWLQNLRQHQGKYDPKIEKEIPEERSKAYPRDTRIKIKGGVAKMMEMMFPAQERNWELSVSTNPSIPKDELELILQRLQSEIDEATGQPKQVDSDTIERAVREWADKRKDKMEDEIADQFDDESVDYPGICKRVVRNGWIYGAGVCRCPMVRTQTERLWEYDEAVGTYVAKEKKLRRPYPEYVRLWDLYMDLSAKNWIDQEMIFERFVLSRHDFRQLAKRPDFKAEVIKRYLAENSSGNYKAKTYEADLHELAKTSNLADRTARRYEIYRGLGFVSAHDLERAGVEIKEKDLDQDILADLWFIDDVVIKAEEAAFGERPSDQYHAFIYAEDEDSGLTGMGLPEEVRDSQMSLCASTRAMMDNMAATAGPILEVNTSLLPRGRRSIGAIHSFMTIEREGDGIEAQYPAVRAIQTPSHIPDLLNIIQMQRQQLDIESNLPAYTMGAMQQQPLGEAFRTSNNMSMMMGAANMVTKDTVRAFDKFTAAVVGSMLKWNMEFNEKEEIKGDYQAKGKGNISLVAKEVRGAALDQFIATLSEEDKAMFDMYGINLDRLKARDLPTHRMLPKEEAMAVIAQMRQATAQANQIEQGLTQAKTQDVTASAQKKQIDAEVLAASAEATIGEILSRIEQNLALAKSAEDKTQLENLKTLLETATQPQQGGSNEQV